MFPNEPVLRVKANSVRVHSIHSVTEYRTLKSCEQFHFLYFSSHAALLSIQPLQQTGAREDREGSAGDSGCSLERGGGEAGQGGGGVESPREVCH